MRYAGSKFTAAEAEQIRRTSRAHLAEKPEIRRRDSSNDVIHKTNADARVAPASEPEDAQTSWAEWVDARIESRALVQCEAIGEVVAALEHALDCVRRDVQLLRDQVEVEVEVKLDRRVAALNSEVEKARSQAPDFASDLSDLQEDVEKLQKTAGWLRAQHSTLEFNQKQLEQQTNKQKVTLTAVQLSAVGGATREVLQRLRDSGFDLMGPSGLPS
jgi:chromosome segregation ATPase